MSTVCCDRMNEHQGRCLLVVPVERRDIAYHLDHQAGSCLGIVGLLRVC